jgi:hypothetical protein
VEERPPIWRDGLVGNRGRGERGLDAVAVGCLAFDGGASGGELRIDVGSGIETEVPDLDETAGHDVQEESADELDRGKLTGLVVAGAEDDVVVVDAEDAVIGDGDAVGVEAEVAKEGIWLLEGSLGEDDPVFAIELVLQPGEGRRREQLGQARRCARGDRELALTEEARGLCTLARCRVDTCRYLVVLRIER